jgi:hypothetical protein
MNIKFAVTATLLVTASTVYADNLQEFILEQLTCQTSPKVRPILLQLEKASKIHSSEMLGIDSISCFRIHGGIEVRGMKFVSVCGYEDDERVRKKRPDLLWRGPGTSPGQFISFGTDAVFAPTQDWYFTNIGTKRLNQAIETEFTNMGDQTEITCSNWMLTD